MSSTQKKRDLMREKRRPRFHVKEGRSAGGVRQLVICAHRLQREESRVKGESGKRGGYKEGRSSKLAQRSPSQETAEGSGGGLEDCHGPKPGGGVRLKLLRERANHCTITQPIGKKREAVMKMY